MRPNNTGAGGSMEWTRQDSTDVKVSLSKNQEKKQINSINFLLLLVLEHKYVFIEMKI